MSEIHLLCKEVIMIEGGRIIFSDSMHAFNNYVQPHSLVVRLENPPTTADLLAIAGVTKVEHLADHQMRIYFDGEEEITERIVATSIQNGWRLREISLDKGLLEDIFKQLTVQSTAHSHQ
jgi:ABC-2 type transport system ATP-binding protein